MHVEGTRFMYCTFYFYWPSLQVSCLKAWKYSGIYIHVLYLSRFNYLIDYNIMLIIHDNTNNSRHNSSNNNNNNH